MTPQNRDLFARSSSQDSGIVSGASARYAEEDKHAERATNHDPGTTASTTLTLSDMVSS